MRWSSGRIHLRSWGRRSGKGTIKKRGGERAYLALKLDLFVVVVRDVPLGEPGLASSRESQCAHSDRPGRLGREYGRTHCLFWIKIKDNILGDFGLAVGRRGDEARMSGSSFLSSEVGCGVVTRG